MAVMTEHAVQIRLLGTALLTAAVCVGCGGAAPSTEGPKTPAPQASPTPQNAAQAAQQMAEGLKQVAQNQNVTPVDFEKLIALMPEPSGWTRSKPDGKQISMGVSMSQAEAEYTKGDSSINLEIVDSSLNQMILAPMSMMLMSTYSERTSTGYKKAAALGGSPGFESWDSESKEAEVTVVVANRFIVTAKGRNVDNVDAVRPLVQAIDLGKLAALK
jgi:hypothetical protein